MATKKHKYSHTHVIHHEDGSHSIHHEHEDGKSHKDYARGSHDEMLDGLIDHTGEANPGEAEASMPPAAAGGTPPMAPPAGA